MELADILQAVSTVGFPIVMCGGLFWYMIKQNESHREETNALKDAISKLEIAITKLCERLGNRDE